MSTHRQLPALPEMNGMSVPVARQRNRRLCEWICEYPPTVAAVSQTTLAFQSKTTKGVGFGVGGGSGSSIDEQTIDLLIARKIKNKILFTNRIETFEIVTTKSTGFTTDCDEDVIFNGKCDTNDKWFWNGSSSTMFVDGNIEVREGCITLNGSRLITEDDASRTIGVKFNYWNTDTNESEIGWFGYDPATKCFKYLLDVTIDTTTEQYECYPCQVISGTPGDICTNTFIGQNLKNKAAEGEDLNIISTTNINTTATQGINLDSATYTLETTTGAIISNTGTEGIDILSSTGNIDIISTSAEMNLQTTDENMTINVDTGNMEICVEDGDLDICVSSSDIGHDLNLTTYGESCITMTSNCDQEQAILIEATEGGIDITANGEPGEDIDITNTASINLTGEEAVDDAICLRTPNGGMCLDSGGIIDIDADDDITIDATNITITVTDDLVINGAEKEDFRVWIPYKNFDVSCGFWQTFRDDTIDTVNNCPVYYWRKVAKAETAYLNMDIVNPYRTDTDKGFRLDSIYFAYSVETADLTSINPKLIKRIFSDGTNVSLTEITLTETDITSGTTIGDHYKKADITSPVYQNDDNSVLNLEIELVTPATSVFKFYGVMLHYTFDAI
jgi:hypothetical protein